MCIECRLGMAWLDKHGCQVMATLFQGSDTASTGACSFSLRKEEISMTMAIMTLQTACVTSLMNCTILAMSRSVKSPSTQIFSGKRRELQAHSLIHCWPSEHVCWTFSDKWDYTRGGSTCIRNDINARGRHSKLGHIYFWQIYFR